MKKSAHQEAIDGILKLYPERCAAIQSRLRDFSLVPSGDYFYELAYCLLTPQSSAVNAGKAIAALQSAGFFHTPVDPEPLLYCKEYYIRFHKTKSQRLIRLREQFPLVSVVLAGPASGGMKREWLSENINGLGLKEASHFLRNIGYRNLAILDRHILRNLAACGVIRKMPETLSRKNYMQIEQKFRTFSLEIGIPMDELDLLFWSRETGIILK
jgi:N-glycosylase/DNA lyase